MPTPFNRLGRLQKAPEFFLTRDVLATKGDERRAFLRNAFIAAGGVASAAAAPNLLAQAAAVAAGDPAILNLPAHSKGLGAPVAAKGYGLPSKYEENLQRRESPGLTRVGAASVSFAPLQGFFGIITPSCTSSGITKAFGTLIRATTASWSWVW
jgi:sulfane dehydrogenase subunit SoxC